MGGGHTGHTFLPQLWGRRFGAVGQARDLQTVKASRAGRRGRIAGVRRSNSCGFAGSVVINMLAGAVLKSKCARLELEWCPTCARLSRGFHAKVAAQSILRSQDRK